MKIKDIADAYDVQYVLLPPDIINSHAADYKVEDGITYFPLYMSPLL